MLFKVQEHDPPSGGKNQALNFAGLQRRPGGVKYKESNLDKKYPLYIE